MLETFVHQIQRTLLGEDAAFGIRPVEVVVDSETGVVRVTKAAFLEDVEKLAQRHDWRLLRFELMDLGQQASRKDLCRVEMFELMLGNWDYRVDPNNLWNMKMFLDKHGNVKIVPDDYDSSTFVTGTSRLEVRLSQKMQEGIEKIRDEYGDQMVNELVRELEPKRQVLLEKLELQQFDKDSIKNITEHLDAFFDAIPPKMDTFERDGLRVP